MSTLTTRRPRHHVYSCLGLLSAFIATLASACSNTESTPNTSTAGSSAGGSAGASSGGSGGGGAGKAGSASAGTANQAGSGGSGGTAGSGGSGGSAGSMPCAVDDECCDDPSKTEPGVCGCGIPDADTDMDGELNCEETCPNDPNKTEPGMCLCGNLENDSDDDGVIDCKQGHFFEAEDGVFSEVDVPVTPIGGEGGAGSGGAGAGGAAAGGADDGAGGEPNLPTAFTIGDDADASEGKYIESPAGFTSDALPGPARASYLFDVPQDHDYVFWARFYAPSRDNNRVWVKVDDGIWTMLRVTTGETWFWYTFHKEGEFDIPIKYTLTEGEHTLQVASDSDGVRIDRFYVTPVLSGDRPAGDDTTCNPPHTVQIGDVCMSSCGMLQGNSCDAAMCAGKTLLPAYDCDICCSTL